MAIFKSSIKVLVCMTLWSVWAGASIITPIKALIVPSTNPETYGIWSETQSGLGHKIWKKSNRTTVEELLQTPWPSIASPTLYNLAMRLLLASTEVPKPQGTSLNLLNLRAQRLYELGEITYAFDLIKGSSAMIDPVLFQKLKFYMLLDQQKYDEALRLALVEAPKVKDVFWQEGILFCQLFIPSKHEAARLALSLYRDNPKIADPEFVLLADHMLGKKKKNIPVSSHSLMKTWMRLNLGLLSDSIINIAPPGYLKMVRSHPAFATLPVTTRLHIQERIIKYHQTPDWIGLLSTVYMEVVTTFQEPCPFDPKADPLGDDPILLEDNPVVRAHLYHLFLKAEDPSKKANYAALLLRNGLKHNVYALLGPLVANGLRDIPVLDPATAPYLVWAKALNAGVKVGPSSTHLTDPAVITGLLIQDPESGWDVVLEQSHAIETSPYKHTLLGLLFPWHKALAHTAALAIWKHQMDMDPELQKSPFLLNLLLQDAQGRKQKGEVIALTILLSAYEDSRNTTGKMIGNIPTMVRALHKLGLEKEAVLLALEKLTTLIDLPPISLANPPAPPPPPALPSMPLSMLSKLVAPSKSKPASNVPAAS